MALGDRPRKRVEAFVSTHLEPDEQLKLVVARSQGGLHPKLGLVVGGLFGLLGAGILVSLGKLKMYALAVTDRRLLIIRLNPWTNQALEVQGSIPLDQPISAEFEDQGTFRELQLSQLRGFDSGFMPAGYLTVWVHKRLADRLPELKTLLRGA